MSVSQASLRTTPATPLTRCSLPRPREGCCCCCFGGFPQQLRLAFPRDVLSLDGWAPAWPLPTPRASLRAVHSHSESTPQGHEPRSALTVTASLGEAWAAPGPPESLSQRGLSWRPWEPEPQLGLCCEAGALLVPQSAGWVVRSACARGSTESHQRAVCPESTAGHEVKKTCEHPESAPALSRGER